MRNMMEYPLTFNEVRDRLRNLRPEEPKPGDTTGIILDKVIEYLENNRQAFEAFLKG